MAEPNPKKAGQSEYAVRAFPLQVIYLNIMKYVKTFSHACQMSFIVTYVNTHRINKHLSTKIFERTVDI